MKLSALLPIAMLCAVAFTATPASAIGLCGLDDDDARPVDARQVDGRQAFSMLEESNADEFDLGRGPLVDVGPNTELVETIVPCAFLESGAFGSFCADVSVYVMTDSGLVLCQVPMLALEVDQEQNRQVIPRDATDAPASWGGLHLAGLIPLGETLSRPTVLLRDSRLAAVGPLLGPADRAQRVITPPG